VHSRAIQERLPPSLAAYSLPSRRPVSGPSSGSTSRDWRAGQSGARVRGAIEPIVGDRRLEQDRPELVAKRQAAIKALLAEFAAGSASTPHTGRPAIRPETVPPTVVRPTDGDRQDDARRRMHGRTQVALAAAAQAMPPPADRGSVGEQNRSARGGNSDPVAHRIVRCHAAVIHAAMTGAPSLLGCSLPDCTPQRRQRWPSDRDQYGPQQH
jgi:hypothetical protein